MGVNTGALGPRICDRSSLRHPGMGTSVSIDRPTGLSDLVRQRPLSASPGETRCDTYRNCHPCRFGAEDSRPETSARRLTRHQPLALAGHCPRSGRRGSCTQRPRRSSFARPVPSDAASCRIVAWRVWIRQEGGRANELMRRRPVPTGAGSPCIRRSLGLAFVPRVDRLPATADSYVCHKAETGRSGRPARADWTPGQSPTRCRSPRATCPSNPPTVHPGRVRAGSVPRDEGSGDPTCELAGEPESVIGTALARKALGEG